MRYINLRFTYFFTYLLIKNIARRYFGLVTKQSTRVTDGWTDRITTPKTALAQLRRAVKMDSSLEFCGPTDSSVWAWYIPVNTVRVIVKRAAGSAIHCHTVPFCLTLTSASNKNIDVKVFRVFCSRHVFYVFNVLKFFTTFFILKTLKNGILML